MGAITRTSSRETAVDFSFPYFISRMGFYTRKPSPVPRVLAILWPYSTFVWLSLAVSVPVFSLVVWTFSKVDKEGFRSNFHFGTALFQVSQMLVMQGGQAYQFYQWMIVTTSLFVFISTFSFKTMAIYMESQDIVVILGTVCLDFRCW